MPSVGQGLHVTSRVSYRHRMRWSVFLLPIALAIAACAAETVATTSLTQPTTTTTAITTTATPPTSTTVPAITTTTEQAMDVEIRSGEVTGTDRFRYDRGQTVEITILSDTAYEIHVHGYDLRYDLVPERQHTIEFTADVPGIFEVETHPDHLILFEIEVGA